MDWSQSILPDVPSYCSIANAQLYRKQSESRNFRGTLRVPLGILSNTSDGDISEPPFQFLVHLGLHFTCCVQLPSFFTQSTALPQDSGGDKGMTVVVSLGDTRQQCLAAGFNGMSPFAPS